MENLNNTIIKPIVNKTNLNNLNSPTTNESILKVENERNLLKAKTSNNLEQNETNSNETTNEKSQAKALKISRTLNHKIRFLKLISQNNLLQPDNNRNQSNTLTVKRNSYALKKDMSKSHEVNLIIFIF